eukprot:jgi/Mesvir1/28025/Mv04633-RA.1
MASGSLVGISWAACIAALLVLPATGFLPHGRHKKHHERLPFEHPSFRQAISVTQNKLSSKISPVGDRRDAAIVHESPIFPSPIGTQIGGKNITEWDCHSSTILEAKPGLLLAAWFAGTQENAPDVGIWMSHRTFPYGHWSDPFEVVAPVSREVNCGVAVGVKCKGELSTWNPVLSKLPSGEILLFYKVGHSPSDWIGYVKRSLDGGVHWGSPDPLPAGITGPAKNKPLVTADGVIIAGASTEDVGAPTATGGRERDWKAWIDQSSDGARTWTRYGPVPFDGNMIQPALFHDRVGRLAMLARSATDYDLGSRTRADPYRHPKFRKKMVTPGRKYIVRATADDPLGQRWSHRAVPINLPCPNSGIDAIKLHNGTLVVVYNDSFEAKAEGRGKLDVSISEDDGDTWKHVATLEDAHGRLEEYSYPAVIEDDHGLVHVTYTYQRKYIKHVALNPASF